MTDSNLHGGRSFKAGYRAIMKDGGIDDPRLNRPAPAPFNPEWRNQPAPAGESVVITNGKYFDSMLDDHNISRNPDYFAWAPFSERLRKAFREVYGKDGTLTPVSRMPECQAAFIASAGAALRDWMIATNRNTVEKRQLYRGIVQDLTWARKGDLKP